MGMGMGMGMEICEGTRGWAPLGFHFPYRVYDYLHPSLDSRVSSLGVKDGCSR